MGNFAHGMEVKMRCLTALKSATGAAALAVAAVAAPALAAPSYQEVECTGSAKVVEHSFMGRKERDGTDQLRFTARLWNNRNAVTIVPSGFKFLPAGEYAFPPGLEPLSIPFTDHQGVARVLRMAITDTEFKGYAIFNEIRPNEELCRHGQALCNMMQYRAQLELKGTCRPK